MVDRIRYRDELQNETTVEALLEPLNEYGIDVPAVVARIRTLDFTGSPVLSVRRFRRAAGELPAGVRNFLIANSGEENGMRFLRAKAYHLHLSCRSPGEILAQVVEGVRLTGELITEAPFRGLGGDAAILAGSLLDHRRHYSLVALSALYWHLWSGDNAAREHVMRLLRVVRKDVGNYYRFFLAAEPPDVAGGESMEWSWIQRLTPPPSSERDTPMSKLVFREMDHPGQVVLFAANMVRRGRPRKQEIIVNPLFGGIEIGHALGAIFEFLGIDGAKEVMPVAFSRHREGRSEVEDRDFLLAEPGEFERLAGRDVLVVDDMVEKGVTLTKVAQFLQACGSHVAMAAIEGNYEFHRLRGNLSDCLPLQALAIAPVSDWRHVRFLEDVISRRLQAYPSKGGGQECQ